MAEVLKRRHGLVALRVMLDAGGEEPRVRFALEVSEKHELRTAGEWSYPPDALGLPARVAGRDPIPLQIPEEMRDGLRAALNEAGSPAALWLHLVRPYAHLGVAPWDRVLTEQLGLPVLRLPDFLVPPPRESPRTLDVALCVSQPAAKSPFDARSFIGTMLGDVAAGVPRAQVTVHLFTDASLYGQLRSAGAEDGPIPVPTPSGDLRLWVHDPGQAARYAEPEAVELVGDRPGSIDNPWLLWMRDTLRGRCLDVVHFGCHGYYALDRGAVALAATPVRNDDQGWARFVGAAELDTFLTQTGAWAVAFSSPPGNYSDAGLRHMADDLAQRKPFATIYHDLAHDAACRDLAAAYAFLFDLEPVEPPPMACVSIYCQPCRVTGDVPEAAAVPAPQATASPDAPGQELAADPLEEMSQSLKAAIGNVQAEIDRPSGEPGGSGGSGTAGSSGMTGGSSGSGMGSANGSGSSGGGGGYGSGMGGSTGSGSSGGGGGYGSGMSEGSGSGSSGGGGYGSSSSSGGGGGYGSSSSSGGGYGGSVGGGMSSGLESSGSGGYGGSDAVDGPAFGGEDADGGFRSDPDDGVYYAENLEAASGGEAEAAPGGEDRAPPPPQAESSGAAGPAAPEAPPAPDPAAAEATLAEVFRTADAVPTWLASAQRFLEGQEWQVRQWEREGAAAGPQQQAELDVAKRTLAQIKEVLARHAVASGTGGSGV